MIKLMAALLSQNYSNCVIPLIEKDFTETGLITNYSLKHIKIRI
jgi:hypothetical protein